MGIRIYNWMKALWDAFIAGREHSLAAALAAAAAELAASAHQPAVHSMGSACYGSQHENRNRCQ